MSRGMARPPQPRGHKRRVSTDTPRPTRTRAKAAASTKKAPAKRHRPRSNDHIKHGHRSRRRIIDKEASATGAAPTHRIRGIDTDATTQRASTQKHQPKASANMLSAKCSTTRTSQRTEHRCSAMNANDLPDGPTSMASVNEGRRQEGEREKE